MSSRLDDVLNGQHANYILPFLWQRGESEEVIRIEVARIQMAGIGALCVEARPHPDFLGPQWWHDLDIIMDEARTRNLRVWLLDDDHFPTGHANGKLKDAPAHLRRLFLKEQHLDACGPQSRASFLIKPWLAAGETLVAVIAAQREAASAGLTGALLDLTPCVQDGVLHWSIPQGMWRIFIFAATPDGGSAPHADYINPLVPESVRVLLDAVYEPVYARYAADFGQTFAGFFSDEPGFYNDPQTFNYASGLGQAGAPLPWRPDLLALLSAELGEEFRPLLPLLFYDSGERTPAVRYAYMNLVSRLYGEHFTNQIGDWCRGHGVAYIGHVLEDNGVHARLGCGPGHYFRALWGQDMAGIDIVLWQLVPGFDEGPFANIAGDADGEFFHYGLAKLGSSLAHIDPKKQGRALAEVYGAYGWAEGLKLMKWMTDHVLVRGINYFVPHAFSPAPFPDGDCPPHLFAHGQNPQYRYYRELNLYTNRISHLLSGGVHVAPAAVLYHAEAEWSGAAQPFHKPVRVLLQNQVDCDVLPADVLAGATVADGGLQVAAERYGCLIVPCAEALPLALLGRLAVLADAGLPLLFVDDLPQRATEDARNHFAIWRLAAHPAVAVRPLAEAAQWVQELGLAEVHVSTQQPSLRYYHSAQPAQDVYFFTNEHPAVSIDTIVQVRSRTPALVYDAFANRTAPLPYNEAGGLLQFRLVLEPYASLVVVTGEDLPAATAPAPLLEPLQAVPLAGPWSLALATAEQYPQFTVWKPAAILGDLSRPEALPSFSGTFRYATTFAWEQVAARVLLDLGELYETAQVWINDQLAGTRICPPYRLEIGDLLRAGANTLVVEVTNTLVKQQRDFFSRFAQQEPSGLLGPVRLLYEGKPIVVA
jgi:hypothetical protein